MMGDATYQETFDDKNQVEVQEDDSEKWKALNIHTRRMLAALEDHASDSETGETGRSLN
ncbi:hypothetical protein ACLB1T_28045 [Escherichia coli]